MGMNSTVSRIIRAFRPGWFGVLMLVLSATLVAAQSSQAEQSSPRAAAVSAPLLRLSGAIGPASADFIARGLHQAAPLVLAQHGIVFERRENARNGRQRCAQVV